MGKFEVVVTAAKPIEVPRALAEGEEEGTAPAMEEVELVYTRMPLTATPGATNPGSSLLTFPRVESQDADGTIHIIAGNLCPFRLGLFDHVGNPVDGSEAVWTWLCPRVDLPPRDEDEEAPPPPPPKAVRFAPLKGDTLKLATTGTYELSVLYNQTPIPSVPRAPPPAGEEPSSRVHIDHSADAARCVPTRVVVTPTAFSIVHSTFFGSGLYSRYPDGVDDDHREIVFLGRDLFGNALGYSPNAFVERFSVTISPMDDAAMTAAAEKTGATGQSTAPLDVVQVTDEGGVLRAVYPILDLGKYALTVSYGNELLFSGTVVSGTGGKTMKGFDRPKNAPHWSEEEEIFAKEDSVAMQRELTAKGAMGKAAEDLKTARFQRQFRKKGQPEPEKPKKLDADEVFRLVDEDGSGSISIDEMRKHMELRGYDEDEIQQAVKALDVDGDGEVSAEEFIRGLSSADADPSLEDLLMPHQAPETVLDSLRSGPGIEIANPATRAISLRQLKEIYLGQVVRRCAAESWIGRRQNADGDWAYQKLEAESVNLYDLASYVVVPATAERRCSLVELVASEEQAPHWVVSSGWSLPLHLLIHCLETHARDVGLGDECRYWISAFSNNQHELVDAVPGDPKHGAFYQAMELADGALSIVDEAGDCFLRTWCEYEAFLAVHHPPKPGFRYGVYTPVAHEYRSDDSPHAFSEMRMAVGLLDGFARGLLAPGPGAEEARIGKLRRQQAFPQYLFDLAIGERSIERGQASRPTDRGGLLNSLISPSKKKSVKGRAPRGHELYSFVDARLQGRLAGLHMSQYLATLTPPPPPPKPKGPTGKAGRAARASKQAEEEAAAAAAAAAAADGPDDGPAEANSGVAQAVPENAEATAADEDLPKLVGSPAERCLRAIKNGHVEKLDLSFELVKPSDAKCVKLLMGALDPSNLTELSLNSCVQITELPRAVFTLKRLTLLSLRGASNLGQRPTDWDEELPNPNVFPSLAALTRLRELDLRDCVQLEEMNDDIADLPELTTLRLGGCSALKKVPPNLGGAAQEATQEPSEEQAEGQTEGQTGEGQGGDLEPPKKLAYLDLTDCTRLLVLPDLSKLGEQCEVTLDGIKPELVAAWITGGRKVASAAFL